MSRPEPIGLLRATFVLLRKDLLVEWRTRARLNALIFFAPILRYARIGKTAENASDYSINKTTVQMLFLPTTHDIKYKAKQVTDSFMQRVGDVGSAVIVFLGTQIFTFGTRGFALLNLGVILVWLVVVVMIVREHAEIEKGNRPEISGEKEKAAEPAAR